MKKILIFSLAYFPKHVGGAEVAIKEKTDRIEDIEFHMVTNRFDSTLPKVEKVGSVLVHRVGIATKNPHMADLKKFPLNVNKFLFQFLAAYTALRLHKKYHYDGVWAMMAHATGVPAAIFKLLHPEVPFILELQEGDPVPYIERKMRPLWPLFRRAFTLADRVSVISTFLGKWALSRGSTGAVVLIPNAVNIKHFSQEYSAEENIALKTQLGKKPGDVYLITTSRLVHKNGLDAVIRALALLPSAVSFVVLGTGPDEQKLKTLAEEFGVGSRVIWVGQVNHKELPLYLKISDIFIRPSRSEGMGNSFIEAMAAGLPVIATQEGGIADFLFDAQRNPGETTTGWAVDVDAPEQIAHAVSAISADPAKTQEVVTFAARMVSEKYDWDHVAEDMRTKVFLPVLTKNPSR